MAFKEGVDVAHVHEFRKLAAIVQEQDELIGIGQATPHEALEVLSRAIEMFPPAAGGKKGAKKDA